MTAYPHFIGEAAAGRRAPIPVDTLHKKQRWFCASVPAPKVCRDGSPVMEAPSSKPPRLGLRRSVGGQP
jgi:hypothetical protein